MINKKIKNNNGFTLVESMVAIFILTISITTFMGIVANGLFISRYARNEITANYLMQEVVDYIRNDRDTSILFGVTTWESFISKYSKCKNSGTNKCYIDVASGNIDVNPHNSDYYLYYYPNTNNSSYYKYIKDSDLNDGRVKTTFKRTVIVKENLNNSDQVDVEVIVEWLNGSKTITKSLKTTLMRW